jgi:Flp pilus assembly protein TadD
MHVNRICIIVAFAACAFTPAAIVPAAAQSEPAATALEVCVAHTHPGDFATTAAADCTHAIALNRKNAIAYQRRCVAYDTVGNYKQALADCNRAIALNPHDAESYVDRGIAYAGTGHDAQAIADYRRALRIDPSSQVAKDQLALATKAR